MNRIGIGRLLGEFLVIVMGVLVALGVDEWRGNLRARADEALYIERLIRSWGKLTGLRFDLVGN